MNRRFLRPGWLVGHALVLLASLVCLRLGWWQWESSQGLDGDAQNLGYALLWPCFAVTFVYMWVRFLKLEQLKESEDMAVAGAHEAIDPEREPSPVTLPPADGESAPDPTTDPDPADAPLAVGYIDDSDDPELAAYNRALADLAQRERRGT